VLRFFKGIYICTTLNFFVHFRVNDCGISGFYDL
jgi:hypothetical protein